MVRVALWRLERQHGGNVDRDRTLCREGVCPRGTLALIPPVGRRWDEVDEAREGEAEAGAGDAGVRVGVGAAGAGAAGAGRLGAPPAMREHETSR